MAFSSCPLRCKPCARKFALFLVSDSEFPNISIAFCKIVSRPAKKNHEIRGKLAAQVLRRYPAKEIAMLATKQQTLPRLQVWEPEKIAIVIPCYNEAQRLPLEPFIDFARRNDDVRLIFVDDGSKDQTISLLCGAVAALPEKVDALMMKKNGGKAEAVREGLKFAVSRGHKYIAFLDADLATPIDAVLDFASVADRMDDIDVVFGSRKGGLGHRVYREFHRKIISRICSTLGRMATGLPIYDTQCGAKLFRNTPQLSRSLEKPFSAGWLFDVELFLRISNPDRKNKMKNIR